MAASITYNLAQTKNISEIIKSYGSRLKGFIQKRVESIEDAEDILQDVFYQLAEADQMMKPIEQISACSMAILSASCSALSKYCVARNTVVPPSAAP